MHKYNVNKDFKFISLFEVPLNKTFLNISNFFLRLFRINKYKEIKFEKILIGDMKVLIIRPNTPEISPCMVYCHGGGFLIEGANNLYKLIYQYTIKSNITIVFPMYHLANKYKHDKIIDDCFKAYNWVIKNNKEYKFDISKLIIGGDSAGGCLAINTYLKAKHNNLPIPKSLFLIYPVISNKQNTESIKNFTDTPVWNSRLNKIMWERFVDDKYIDITDQLEDITVDNIYIETAYYDCLKDEAIDFYNEMKIKTKNIVLNNTIGTIHGYDCILKSQITKNNVLKRIEFLKQIKY